MGDLVHYRLYNYIGSTIINLCVWLGSRWADVFTVRPDFCTDSDMEGPILHVATSKHDCMCDRGDTSYYTLRQSVNISPVIPMLRQAAYMHACRIQKGHNLYRFRFTIIINLVPVKLVALRYILQFNLIGNVRNHGQLQIHVLHGAPKGDPLCMGPAVMHACDPYIYVPSDTS